MKDPYSHYEQGAERMLSKLGQRQDSYGEALTLQGRLIENISRTRLYGDNETNRSERSQIIDGLNRLALNALGTSFNEFCPVAAISPTLSTIVPSQIGSLLSVPDQGLFLDREAIVNQIEQQMSQQRFIIIQGLAGIGKTSLISHVAGRISEQFTKVAWIRCKDRTDYSYVLLMISALLALLGDSELLETTLDQHRKGSPERSAGKLLHLLQTSKVLLVLDDFHHALDRNRYIADKRLQTLIEFLLEKSFQSRVLLTTRFAPKLSRRYLSQYVTVEVGGLDKDYSKELLRQTGTEAISADDLKGIHESLRGHPFALKILAGLTKFYPLSVLLKDRHLFLDQCGTNLLDKLFRVMPHKEVDWLMRISVIRASFSIETLATFGAPLEAIELLRERFLIDYERPSGSYQVHPLIREFALSRLGPLKRREYHAIAARYYSATLAGHSIDRNNFAGALEASYHYSRAGDLQGTLGFQFGLTESLHYLGLQFFRQRVYEKAAKCYLAIIDMDCLDDKANFYYAASLDLQGATSRIKNKKLIDEHYQMALKAHPANAQYLDYYGFFLMNTERDSEALRVFEQGVQLGARCPTLYQRYATLLIRLGNVKHAELVFQLGCRRAYNSGQLFLEYAKFKKQTGDLDTATSILQQGLHKNPDYEPLKTKLIEFSSTH